MRRHIALVLAVVLVSGVALAQAQEQKQQEQMPLLGKPTHEQTLKSHQDLQQFKSHLQQSNVSPEKILQTMYVVGAEVEPFSPANVLAVKDDLKLTSDQEQKLKELMQHTEQQTKQILDENQQAKVEQMQPMTVFYAMQQLEPILQQQRTGMPGQQMGRPVQPGQKAPEKAMTEQQKLQQWRQQQQQRQQQHQK